MPLTASELRNFELDRWTLWKQNVSLKTFTKTPMIAAASASPAKYFMTCLLETDAMTTPVSLICTPKAQSLHPNQTQIYDSRFNKSIQNLGKSSEIYSKLAERKQLSQLAWDWKHCQKYYGPVVQQKVQQRVVTNSLSCKGNAAKAWKGTNMYNHIELDQISYT